MEEHEKALQRAKELMPDLEFSAHPHEKYIRTALVVRSVSPDTAVCNHCHASNHFLGTPFYLGVESCVSTKCSRHIAIQATVEGVENLFVNLTVAKLEG